MKPFVYVTRHLPEPAYQKLVEFCQPEIWDVDTPPAYEEMRARLPGKAGLLCMLTDRIDVGLMDAAPGLRVISQSAVGYDNIAVAAAAAHGIAVGNTPGVLTETTADFAFMLLMAAARRVVEGADFGARREVANLGAHPAVGPGYPRRHVGPGGAGAHRRAMARRARGFDMQVLYYDLARQPAEAELGVEFCPLEELLRRSDFVSLHVNLTAQTRRPIRRARAWR